MPEGEVTGRRQSCARVFVRAKSVAGCCFMELKDGPLPLCRDRRDDSGSDKGIFFDRVTDERCRPPFKAAQYILILQQGWVALITLSH